MVTAQHIADYTDHSIFYADLGHHCSLTFGRYRIIDYTKIHFAHWAARTL